MNCDICGRKMYGTRFGLWCNAHRLSVAVSGVEEMREQERTCSAITAFVCGAVLAAVMLGSLIVRGCQPAPEAVADSICEQCGEIIGAADHGRCPATEVASCE